VEETFQVLTSRTFYNTHFLPYNSHIPEPRGLDLFTKGLVEAGINKDLIKNEYLLSKMEKEEYEMPQYESVESESGDDDGDNNEEDDMVMVY
jgi:hypothetical protein